MPSSSPKIAQLISRCTPRQHSRPVLSQLRERFPLLAVAILLLISATTSFAQLKQVPTLSTVTGTGIDGNSGDGGPASSAVIGTAAGVALDHAGNLYFVDIGNCVVRRVDAVTGTITTVAGNGSAGYSGDGGPATSAQLNLPSGLAIDASGNLYIADEFNVRVRKVTPAGVITTVAGSGGQGSAGDGGPATSATFLNPQGVAIDAAGNLYIADSTANVIREVNASTGVITTIVGAGGPGAFSGDGGAATSAHLQGPSGMAFDAAGDLYFADQANNRIRMVSASTKIITTVAGSAAAGSYSGDGAAATSAVLNSPYDVKLDSGGNIYLSDTGNNRVRMVSASSGIITTVVGNGQATSAGDYGPSTAASINEPLGLGFDNAGDLYIGSMDYVRKSGLLIFPPTNVAEQNGPFALNVQTTAAETISSFTVPASQNSKNEYSVYGVQGCATDGVTVIPAGTNCEVEVIFDPAYPGIRSVPLRAVTSTGNVDIGLVGTGVAPLVALTPGTMSTIAGEINVQTCAAYSGPALGGPVCNPSVGSVDFAGNIYFAAYFSNTVSKIDTSGNITVIAGTGAGGLSGVGGPATSATFDRPADVVVDPAGNVYFIAETAQQVLRIDAVTHILTSVAGNGNAGYSGDNGPATQASLNYPEGLALDMQGNLYIEDHDNNLVRKVDNLGIITTVAGNPAIAGQDAPAYSGDGGPATQANLFLDGGGVYASYDSIAVDGAGNLYIGDSGHQVVRKVTTDGIIHTVAGNNAKGSGFSGDGAAATSAQLNYPMGVTVDAGGDLYIADFGNDRIRKVDAATQTITTVAGSNQVGFIDGVSATQATLNGPQEVRLDGVGNLVIADTKNNLIREVNVTTSTLTFPTPTPVPSEDTTDGFLTATVSNIGNAALTIPQPTTGQNPSISGSSFSLVFGETCPSEGPGSPSPGTLAQGSSCGIEVAFAPVSVGNNTGSVVLTDNSLNAPTPYVTQTISLVGTGLPGTTGVLAIAPTTQTFPSTPVGSTSATLSSVLTNNTGGEIYLSSGSLTDAVDFSETDNCPGLIAPNATCTITFTFMPQSSGPLTSTYSIHDLDNPNSPLTVVLTGNATNAPAPQAALTPSTVNFSTISGTTSPPATFTLTNAGNAALAITSVKIGGANAGSFTMAANTCGSSLAASGSCTIMVSFAPTAAGAYSAMLQVTDAVGVQSSSLTGTSTAPAAPVATLTPAKADFGSLASGTTSTAQTFTLANTGSSALTISGITLAGANASMFADTTTCGATLAAGTNCTIAVTFTPSGAGSFAATLTVADNAAGSPQTSALTGTGTVPPDFTVAASPAAQAVLPGAVATYGITITSTNGSFSNPVALTATGIPGATITFSPASVTPGASSAQSTMTVRTVTQDAKNSHREWPFAAPVFAALLLLLPNKKLRSRKAFTNLACIVVLLGIAASTIGCGGGFALPSKTYTITVTGTSGSDTHSTTVTLTVQ